MLADASGNPVFQTPDYGAVGALSGLAQATTLPAGLLASNQLYGCSLTFKKVYLAGATNYPGAGGYSGFSSTTDFYLLTRGPGNPPRLSSSLISSNHSLMLSCPVVSSLSYCLE